MNSRLGVLIITLLLWNCEGWSPQLLTSEDFEPKLNVLAVLSPDMGGIVYVEVQRILPLEGPDYTIVHDTVTEIWQNPETGQIDTSTVVRVYYNSKYDVPDATVTLSDGSQTWAFEHFVYEGDWEGVSPRYKIMDADFIPVEGKTYVLEVSTPDGLSVTGTTTIPARSKFVEADFPDTLRLTKSTPLRWTASTGRYLVSQDFVEATGIWCYGGSYTKVVDDTSLVMEPISCGDTPPEDTAYAIQEFMLMSVDDNYYQYFIEEEDAGDAITYFLLGSGEVGSSWGIEGGYGVMASFRYHSVRRPSIK